MASAVNVALIASSKFHYREGPGRRPRPTKPYKMLGVRLYPPKVRYERTGILASVLLIWVKEAMSMLRPSPSTLFGLGFTLLSVCSATAQSPAIGSCPVLPADNIWNTPVDQLPVSADRKSTRLNSSYLV